MLATMPEITLQKQTVAELRAFYTSLAPQTEARRSISTKDIQCRITRKSLPSGTSNTAKLHEIELLCQCCHSKFVVRAAHECDTLVEGTC